MDETHKQTISHLEIEKKDVKEDNAMNTIQTLRASLEAKITAIVNEIRSDNKMHAYLQDFQITPADLLLSYEQILQTNKSLATKSKDNSIILHATKGYFQLIDAFFSEKNTEGLDSKGKIGWYVEIEIKLHCCSLELFQKFHIESDITNSPKQNFPKVWDKITLVKANDANLIKKQYKSLKRLLHAAVASTLNQASHEYALIKKISFGMSFTKYLVMNDSSKLRSFDFYRKPTLEMAQMIWNTGEKGASKQLSKLRFEGVQSNIKIYVPVDGVIDPNVDLFQERPNTIIIRVLSKTQLVKYPSRQRQGCCCNGNKEFATYDSAIIHMHGGGFISLSSRSMQIFTRKWANQLGIPIFCIDYRMPPDHPFPHAPNDCFVAYRFIINHIHEYLNIRPVRIYLAGDSAGGNIACSLTGLILKNKEKNPNGIYLVYPSLDLRKIFSPSKIYSITDPLLWPKILLLCVESYLKFDSEKAKDPLASPVLLTEEYVGGQKGDNRFPLKWPKTIVTVGNRDPLQDDSLMLMQKMVQSNIDCECVLYDELSHGFLNTGAIITECQKTINNSIIHLKKLIQPQEKL